LYFRTQGLAFTNIPLDPKIKYFPMACSTSAKSVIKLMNATSYEDNLQFNCMKKIAKNPQLLQIVQNIPGLKPLCHDLWFLQCKEQFRYGEFEKNNLLLEDEAILCGLKKKNLRHINDCMYFFGVFHVSQVSIRFFDLFFFQPTVPNVLPWMGCTITCIKLNK
jgi:hypothetical protein